MVRTASESDRTDDLVIYTIGHSTTPVKRFLAILQAHSVELLVDIRTIPRSRHNPQYNKEELASSLKSNGMRYVHMKELGGLRHPLKDSPNAGWRNENFRGYADYMQTNAFGTALRELVEMAKRKSAALMCAEGNPFRCHRSLVADALAVRGLRVIHISSAQGGRFHRVTQFAKVNGVEILYPSKAEFAVKLG